MKIHLILDHVIVCNKNKEGASGWKHTSYIQNVTCKRCLKRARKGFQISLEI